MTSSSQRVRVKTHPPLTSFQAWLILDPNQSINNFKASILESLPNSNPSTSRYSPSQIQLESQGFAFLDQCQCSVIDVNDVIDVKLIPVPKERKSKKRPRTSDSIPPSPSTKPISKLQPEIPSETRVVKALPTSSIPSKEILKPVEPNVTNPIKPVVPGTGSSRTKARNLRKRKRKSLLRQQESIKLSDEKCIKEARSLSTDKNGNIQKVSGIVKDPQVKLTTKKSKSSSSESSAESSETESDSGSDSTSNSKSASSSDTDSDSDSDSQSSAPSSAPIKPPHLNPTPSTSNSKPNHQIQQKIVPIIQNESFKMLSLSNKNKRKNLRQCSGYPNQSSKIIFCTNNPEDEEIRLRNSSPKYTPASPTFKNPEIFNNEEEEIRLEKDELNVGHGPPPSLRTPSSIPKNIKITWIDVEDPNWYAGQINHLLTHDQENFLRNTQNCTTSKRKRAQNRKKQVKKNKRAKAAKLRNESFEEEEEEGMDDEIEDEYNEFIKCGGHSIKATEDTTRIVGMNIKEKEKEIKEWDKYEKVEVEKTRIGDRIAIKVIELSMETLTPELIIYYGTLLQTNHISFTIKIDPNCLPELNSSLNQDFTEEEEGEEGYSTLRERELIKESYRDSVMEGIWNGNENEKGEKDCRNWNWAEVAELRRM